MSDEPPVLQAIRDAGGLATNGPWPEDRLEGWGKHPMHGRLAHWYKRIPVDAAAELSVSHRVFALCGMVDTIETDYDAKIPRSLGVHLLGPGNLPRCRRCDAKSRMRRVK